MANTMVKKKERLVGARPDSHIKAHAYRLGWYKNKPVKNYTNSLQDKSSGPIDKYTLRQTRKHGNANIPGHPWIHSQALRLILNKQTEAEVDSR